MIRLFVIIIIISIFLLYIQAKRIDKITFIDNNSYEINGVQIKNTDNSHNRMISYISNYNLEDFLDVKYNNNNVCYRLNNIFREKYAPNWDIVNISKKYPMDTQKEMLVIILLSPIQFEYPSFDEFLSSINIRINIINAARKTFLKFNPIKAILPEEYWERQEDGYHLKNNKSLIDGIEKTIFDDKKYSVGCRLASQFVVLYGILLEIKRVNLELLERIEEHYRKNSINKIKFSKLFFNYYGVDSYFPKKYYIIGDRVWFKNPFDRSSDIDGNEGSWRIYYGKNSFNIFWEKDRKITLEKIIRAIYIWNESVSENRRGLYISENKIVWNKLKLFFNINKYQKILDEMSEYTENNGTIPNYRMIPKYVHPGTTDIIIK